MYLNCFIFLSHYCFCRISEDNSRKYIFKADKITSLSINAVKTLTVIHVVCFLKRHITPLIWYLNQSVGTCLYIYIYIYVYVCRWFYNSLNICSVVYSSVVCDLFYAAILVTLKKRSLIVMGLTRGKRWKINEHYHLMNSTLNIHLKCLKLRWNCRGKNPNKRQSKFAGCSHNLTTF